MSLIFQTLSSFKHVPYRPIRGKMGWVARKIRYIVIFGRYHILNHNQSILLLPFFFLSQNSINFD